MVGCTTQDARASPDLDGHRRGMCVTLSALRVYVLPLASFLLQLEPLPQAWPSEEMKLVNTLFPGPAAGTHQS